MSESGDGQSREIVIAAKLEENGLAIRIRSRAVSAIEALISSLVDIPTAFAEGVARKKRVQTQIEERLKLAEAEVAERKLKGLPSAGDQLLEGIFKDAARKQINATSVAIEAIEALKGLPPPTDQSVSDQDQNEKVDPDWMNQFQRYAEDASSEQLQQLWGRVLAGEINRAGSFSRHTLRFIAELDKETAENCEYVAEREVDGMIPKGDEWKEGRSYMVGLDLERLGLVEGVGGLGSERHYTVGDIGYAVLQKGNRAAIIRAAPSTKLTIKAFLLTRMGIEVFSLLSPTDPTLPLRAVAERVSKGGVSRIELGTLVKTTATGSQIRTDEVLWEAPQADEEQAS